MTDSVQKATVRPAISSDVPALAGFDHGYSTDHVWQMGVDEGQGHLGVSFREVRLPRPMRVQYPRDPQLLVDDWTKRAGLLVAEAGEAYVGYVSLSEGPAPSSAWVTDLVVDLQHRRQGFATKLLGAARSWSLERSYNTLFLEMQSKNYPAIRLARKTGFNFAGYSDRYYPDQDIALFFALELR